MRIVRSRKIKRQGTKYHLNDNPDLLQSRFDDQELRAMQRSPIRTNPPKCLYSLLAEELFWGFHFPRQ
jgi:hypothetical protein